MMSGPLRYLSWILEVCWDIIETSVTENFWFYRCPVKTRSSSFLPLIQSLWKFVIIAGLVMMSPCWFFALSLFVPHRHFIDMTSIVTVNILLKYFSSSRWNYRVNYMAKQLFLSEMVWLAPPFLSASNTVPRPALYVNEHSEQHKQVLWSHFSLNVLWKKLYCFGNHCM